MNVPTASATIALEFQLVPTTTEDITVLALRDTNLPADATIAKVNRTFNDSFVINYFRY